MKNLIRKKIKNKLVTLDSKIAIKKSLKIQENLFNLDFFNKAQKIGIYYSKENEVSTINLISKLLKKNKTVIIPKINNSKLEFKKINSLKDLEKGSFDIFEPLAKCKNINPKELDLIIIPCIAIDEKGNRIGRGKGFFDKFLSRNKNIKTICLAYELQILPKIDPENHDQKIDIIVSEKKVIFTTKTSPYENKLLDGKKLANKIILELKEKIRNNNIQASLAVILAGDNPASESYVKIKKEKCKTAGINFKLIKFSKNVSEKQLNDTIENLNKNSNITGILVQLPLPKHINTQKILDYVHPNKDVDGLCSTNKQLLISGKTFLPCCTPKGIIRLLKENNISLENKKVVLVGHGHLVGQPLAWMIKQENNIPIICNKTTQDLKKETINADILISATGVANLISGEHIKKGAIVIDAGTTKLKNKIVGDVNFSDIVKKASLISPVPGGVGPMTVAMLIENIIEAHKIQHEK
jgi:methylenetetrahydrofolate dehydrogenase (NADP+) / methenyltetrahydrofolate cyclohydrolase